MSLSKVILQFAVVILLRIIVTGTIISSQCNAYSAGATTPKLDVRIHVSFSLTHEDKVFDSANAVSQIELTNDEDSCRLLQMAYQYGRVKNDNNGGFTDGIRSLVINLCEQEIKDKDDENYDNSSNSSSSSIGDYASSTRSSLERIIPITDNIGTKSVSTSYSDTDSHDKNNNRNVTSDSINTLKTHNNPFTISNKRKLTNLFQRNRSTNQLRDLDEKTNSTSTDTASNSNIFDKTVESTTPSSPTECKGGVSSCVCDSEKPILYDDLYFLSTLLPALSSDRALLDVSSPQYRAACWIVHDDPRSLIDERSTTMIRTQLLQRYVLAVLYFSTKLGASSSSNDIVFLSSKSVCEWTGISCDSQNITVTDINFEKNNLTGTIPKELSHLRHLVKLDFHLNELSGTVPEELGLLTSLRYLDLRFNNLEGPIPAKLFDATSIEILNLSRNRLSGTIPNAISRLSNIIQFSVGNNALTQSIPHGLYETTTLEHLWLTGNELSSELSSRIGNLQNLQYLWLEENKLHGSLPTELGLLKNLKVLDLRSNNFDGDIPSTLSNITNLEAVYLEDNNIGGTMPEVICEKLESEESFTSLEVDCYDEYWEAEVNCDCCTKCLTPTPQWFGDCPDTKIEINFANIYSHNYTSGTHIETTWNLTRISTNEVILSDSSDLGHDLKYSVCVASTDSFKFQIESLNFDEAEFEYAIKANNVDVFNDKFDQQDSLGNYEKNVQFRYDPGTNNTVDESVRNEINEICNRTKYSSMVTNIYKHAVKMSGRELVDDTSTEQYRVTCGLISSLKAYDPNDFAQLYVHSLLHDFYGLDEMRDDNNTMNSVCDGGVTKCNADGTVYAINMAGIQLDKRILPEIGHLNDLKEIVVPNARLKGSLPDFFRNLRYLELLDLSNNNLEGHIPDMPLKLRTLDLSNNKLKGSIKSEIGNILGLENILLQNNKLSALPPLNSMKQRNLRYIDVRNNLLEGTLGRPESRTVFVQLEHLDLSENLMTGELFDELLSLPFLKFFNVSRNGFGGGIPSKEGANLSIEVLDMSQNQFRGTIPDSISEMSDLTTLYLQDNKLTGTVSSTLANLQHLTKLRLSHNNLRGTIPNDIMKDRDESERITVHLYGNFFEGEAPPLSNADYITDCGFPSNVRNPVSCQSCTICCNSDEFCQKNSDSAELSDIMQAAVIFPVLLSVLLLFYAASRNVKLKEYLQDIDLVSVLGNESAYVFFLSTNPIAWVTAVLCTIFQILILYLYLAAVNIQYKGTDWEYTKICPAYDLSCIEGKSTDFLGYFLFATVMAAWVMKDGILFVKLFFYSVRVRSIDCLVSSSVLICLIFLTVYASISYNRAIATTNTELIMNAVILLFVTEMDEKVFEVVQAVNPIWVDEVLVEIYENVRNHEGRGLFLSIYLKAASRYNENESEENPLSFPRRGRR